MREIKIYQDKEKKHEIKDSVEFEKVVAGEKSTKELYIYNTLNYHIDIELKLIGKDIKIIKTIKNIKPMELEKVEFEIIPKLTTMKPITAKLNIKVEYVVT